jgi:predicted dehydrogenase
MDALPWITGRRFARTTAARAWNARAPQYPHFKDAAQFMLELDNGGGVLGDVSYLAPDGCGYSAPQYWRLTCHGTGGVAEICGDARLLLLATHSDKAFREIPLDPPRPDAATLDFLHELAGERGTEDSPLTTAVVIDASRQALLVQQAADAARA